MKLIIGAGTTAQDGWISTDKDSLDIRNFQDWQKLFAPNSLDAVLSEHVLEHMQPAEAEATSKNVFAFLKPGGRWRIAVPDLNNPDPGYQDWNKPDGYGQQLMRKYFYRADQPCHFVFFNLESLTALLSQHGFSVEPLEWYDESGKFHRKKWNQSDGYIYRCQDNPYLLTTQLWSGVYNTSLIVDAFK